MATFYLTLLVLGGGVMVIQLALSVFGVGDHGDLDHDADHGLDHDGLDLFTVRALSAAAAAFGAVGLGQMQWGVPGWLALPGAGIAGAGGAVGVALLLRSMHRLAVDKSFNISMTIGTPAKVALGIPGARAGEGKVHLVAHSQFMELNAITAEPPIAAGEDVYVVDTIAYDTVIVSRTPLIPEAPR
jgi:hypothetical protein